MGGKELYNRLPSCANRAIKLPAHPPNGVHFCIWKSAKGITMAELNPAKFIREVRSEVGKVSWPTRKETIVSTIMVIVLAFIAALFFLAVDAVFASAITWILGLGQ